MQRYMEYSIFNLLICLNFSILFISIHNLNKHKFALFRLPCQFYKNSYLFPPTNNHIYIEWLDIYSNLSKQFLLIFASFFFLSRSSPIPFSAFSSFYFPSPSISFNLSRSSFSFLFHFNPNPSKRMMFLARWDC